MTEMTRGKLTLGKAPDTVDFETVKSGTLRRSKGGRQGPTDPATSVW